jgi:ribonuclease HII
MKTALPAQTEEKKAPPSRQLPDFHFVDEAIRQGYRQIAGIDEVGRGPLAGPVVAAAVILPDRYSHPYLDDSKRVAPGRRKEVRRHLVSTEGVYWAIGEASVEEIDRLNIHHASLLAMRRAVEAMKVVPDFLLIDGNRGLSMSIPDRPLVGGDGRCRCIAAASIIAKEHRDEIMVRLHETYPHYGFARHKGYATSVHRQALKIYGPSPIHRRTFLQTGPAPQSED